jgi:hypothetical protein
MSINQKNIQQTSSKACTAHPNPNTTEWSYPLSMQVTPDRLGRLEPSKLQFVPLQYLEQQLYEYGRLIVSITIETLVIFRPGKLYNAVTGVIAPGQNQMAMLTPNNFF